MHFNRRDFIRTGLLAIPLVKAGAEPSALTVVPEEPWQRKALFERCAHEVLADGQLKYPNLRPAEPEDAAQLQEMIDRIYAAVPASIPQARRIAAKPALYVYDSDMIGAFYENIISDDRASGSIAVPVSTAALRQLDENEKEAALSHEIMHHLVHFNPELGDIYRPLYKKTQDDAMRHMEKELGRELTQQERDNIAAELVADRGILLLTGRPDAARKLFAKIERNKEEVISLMFAREMAKAQSQAHTAPFVYSEGEVSLERERFKREMEKRMVFVHPCIHLRKEAVALGEQWAMNDSGRHR